MGGDSCFLEQDLLDRAQTSPKILHGPNATELSVEKLLEVFGEYEGIHALSARALEVRPASLSHLPP